MGLYTIERFAIPPNPLLSTPNPEEVMAAGPNLIKGKPVGLITATITVEGANPNGFTGGKGKLFPYHLAWFFVADAFVPPSREFAEAIAHPALMAVSDAVLPGASIVLRSILEGAAQTALFPEKEPHAAALAESEAHGFWVIPPTHWLEIETKKHRFSQRTLFNAVWLTVGTAAGDRTRLKVLGLAPDAVELLSTRFIVEQTEMFRRAVCRLFLGDGALAHWDQLPIEKIPLQENAARICATELELLEPLLPAYRTLFGYKEWVGHLEACALGKEQVGPGPRAWPHDLIGWKQVADADV